MSGLDSTMAALVDRALAVADLVQQESPVETWDTLERRNALGIVLARHVRTLCEVIVERAEGPRDVRRV